VSGFAAFTRRMERPTPGQTLLTDFVYHWPASAGCVVRFDPDK
jgi:hypothetical protein